MKFKNFILNENKHYLGQRAGDILSAVQSLNDDAEQMGTRAVIRASEGIVNQIRRILHGHWEEDEVKYLKTLQKVGVAIMRCIDTNDDIQQTVASSAQELQSLLDDLEVPVNSLGSEQGSPAEEEEESPLQTGSQLDA